MSEIICKPITDAEKAYILQHFDYSNGVITRNDRRNSEGSCDSYGYKRLKIKGKSYLYHRVVWLLNTGEWPDREIDHIDRDKLNNLFENLRISSRIEQNRNKEQKPNETTGVPGIYFDKTRGLKKNYTFKYDGKTYRFYTLDEAKREKDEMRKAM